MSDTFARNLRIVTGVHVVLIGVLFVSSWVRSCKKARKDVVIPLEFMVQVPPAEAPTVQNDIPVPAKKPPIKKSAEKPVKKPVKKPIKISDKVITRPPNKSKPVKKPLSPEEIQKLLEQGAKPSDRTVIPEDDQIYKAMVKKAFMNAWAQPSLAEAGDAVTEVEIRLAGDGTVASARISKNSGVRALDESVAKSLRYVKRINGLSADFLSRYKVLTISFRVGD